MLHKLQDEYSELSGPNTIGNRLDKKLALGQKIASLKMELAKSVEQSLKAIDERIEEISGEDGEMHQVLVQINEMQSQKPEEWKMPIEVA